MFTKRLSKRFIKLGVLTAIIALLIIGQSTVGNAQGTTKMDRNDPKLVTFYTHDDDLALINSDPQLAGSIVSVRWVDNTFLGLTDLSPETAQVRPEAATEWSSKDSVTWTFKLRKDIPWVSWNPDTQEAKVQRMVTAQDVVVGTRRACDARL